MHGIRLDGSIGIVNQPKQPEMKKFVIVDGISVKADSVGNAKLETGKSKGHVLGGAKKDSISSAPDQKQADRADKKTSVESSAQTNSTNKADASSKKDEADNSQSSDKKIAAPKWTFLGCLKNCWDGFISCLKCIFFCGKKESSQA